MVALSMLQQYTLLRPMTQGANTGFNHQAALKRTIFLIRTPQMLLDYDLSRSLATALSTSPDILRN
jgi:hypothetical protein